MAILETTTVIDAVLSTALDAVKENLSRNEAVVRALQRLGVSKSPTADDFDTLYVFALVEYGIFKSEPVLRFFRNAFIREGFRSAFYSGNNAKLLAEVEGILDWNRESGDLGYLGTNMHKELEEFRVVFVQLVRIVRTPSQVEDTQKLDSLHDLLVSVQEHVRLLDKGPTVAEQIARDRPNHWEYLLTLELMRTRLAPIRKALANKKRGFLYRQRSVVVGNHVIPWFSKKLSELQDLVTYFMIATTEELKSSWGEPGEPGDALLIQEAVDAIVFGCRGALEWEMELHFAQLPGEYERLRTLMSGWAVPFIDEIEKIPQVIGDIIGRSDASGTFHIDLVFQGPQNADAVHVELARLRG